MGGQLMLLAIYLKVLTYEYVVSSTRHIYICLCINRAVYKRRFIVSCGISWLYRGKFRFNNGGKIKRDNDD